MNIQIERFPSENDWFRCKRLAFETIGKEAKQAPTLEWKHKILKARHSPIRTLMFTVSFQDIPTWVATHFVRHIHAQPYVQSQRNDRQTNYDRRKAPQDSPINMVLEFNAEELMIISNKRLCNQASKETKEATQEMCKLIEEILPEFNGLLVPMCEYHGGICHEFNPCGKCDCK